MRWILASLAVLSLSAHADIYKETQTIELELSQKDPDYDTDVRYKLVLEGLKEYKVSLETWKFVDEGEFATKTLRLQKTDPLFEKLPVTLELHERDPFHDYVGVKSIEGKNDEGAILFRAPDQGMPQVRITTKALAKIFPKVDKQTKFFYPLMGSVTTLQLRYGRFAVDIKDVQHLESHSDIEGFPYTVYYTRFTVFGNDVRSISDCKGNPIKADRFDSKQLERQGFTNVHWEGVHEKACIRLLDADEKVLLEHVL